MSSQGNGTSTLTNSVTNISSFGFWVMVENKEYFVSFTEYPEFKNATIDNIFDMKILSPNQLYWEKLDIDIELDALDKPDQFPLQYR
jgi:hypothetical protein